MTSRRWVSLLPCHLLGRRLVKQLRVAHIEAGRHLYGGAQQVLYLLSGLADKGVESLLVCAEAAAIAAPARALGVRVAELKLSGDLDMGATARIRTALMDFHPDLVHCHSRRGADIWGGLAARWCRVPCVLSRRVDNREGLLTARLKYPLYKQVIAISLAIRDVLLDCGVPASKVSTVRSAVDFETFQVAPDRAGFLNRFQLPENAQVLGMVAQLIERKGHAVALTAMESLLAAYPSLHLLIMGRGPLETELHNAIAARGLVGRVHMTGFIQDLPTVLPNLAAVLHPAYAEGLGVALLQAASAGVPVIAGRAGGMTEAVLDGDTGLLVTPGDDSGVARAICALLDDPARAKQMGERGRARMQRDFSIPAMAQGNLAIYERVLAESRSG